MFGRVVITISHQTLIRNPQFLDARSENLSPFFRGYCGSGSIVLDPSLLGLKQLKRKLIGKIQALTRTLFQEIGNLKSSDSKRPGREFTRSVKLLKFFPKHDRSLLIQIVSIVDIANQRINVRIQLRLYRRQLFCKFIVRL